MPNEAPTASAESLRPCTYEGFMTKEGSNVKSWKKRWFILKDNLLYYFKNMKSSTPKGCLVLSKTSSVVDRSDEVMKLKKKASFSSSKTMPFMFAIVTDTHTLFTSVETPQDRKSWLEALRNTIASLQSEQTVLQRPSLEMENVFQPPTSLPPSKSTEPNDGNLQNQQNTQMPQKQKLPVGAVSPLEPNPFTTSRQVTSQPQPTHQRNLTDANGTALPPKNPPPRVDGNNTKPLAPVEPNIEFVHTSPSIESDNDVSKPKPPSRPPPPKN